MRAAWSAALALLAAATAVLADDATPTPTPTSSSSPASAATAATILVTGTALPALVAETEPCALLCYAAACEDSACATGDFACVCGNPNSLVVKLGLCTGGACDGQAQFDSGDWIARLCSVYSAGAGGGAAQTADVASASSLLDAEIAAASAAASAASVDATATMTGTATATGTTTGTTSSSTTTSSSAGHTARLPRLLWAAAAAVGLVL